MLGTLIASLDRPGVALDFMAALDQPALQARLADAADASGRPQADIVTSAVRGFIDTASDDDWLQLMGIMGRAADPGKAAMHAILEKALPGPRAKP
jgi:hypothetical protein